MVMTQLLLVQHGYAQEPTVDTANKIRIVIANTGAIEHYTTDSGSFNKFIDDVVIYQGTDTLYCDSLYQFVEQKKLEAFSNVRIAQQGGTEGVCDFLRYASDKRIAYMTGQVILTDGKNKLWCEELTYDLTSKTGIYNRSGTLQSDSTIVTSNYGVYNVRSHDARFTGNVLVLDPQYKIASKDMGYNTESRVETFYDYSVVTSDSGRSVLTAWNGTYDSKNVIAKFSGHSSIWNDGQYIEADSMHYDKTSGYGFAIGNVISTDTAQHATIYCGRADYFRKQRILWATEKPVMELANGKDTFYMRADTFYAAPMIKVKGHTFQMPQDTPDVVHNATADSIKASTGSGSKPTNDTIKRKINKPFKPVPAPTAADTIAIDTVAAQPDSTWIIPPYKRYVTDLLRDTAKKKPVTAATEVSGGRHKKRKQATADISTPPTYDSTGNDSTAPVFFTGYHHVLIFSDSMQAKCDSITYTRADSIVRMMYEPVAWARGSQITGDTIMMLMDSGGVKSMYIPNNSLMVSRSGPEQAELFDQIQGKSLTAFFKDNAIRKMIVNPDAQCIYYTKDDGGAYIGVNDASSVLMRIYFGTQQIKTIRFEQDIHQQQTPMDKADLPNERLSRFHWRYEERPKDKHVLFE